MKIYSNISYTQEEYMLVVKEHLAAFTHLYKWAGSTQFFFTSLTAYMFYGLIDEQLIVIWLGLHWLNAAIQSIIFNAWKKTDFNSDFVNTTNKVNIFFLFSIFNSGLLWGLALLTLDFQQYPSESIYLCIYTFGAITSSVVMGSYWITPFLCYCIPLYALGALSFAIGVPETSWFSATAMVVFFVYMASAILTFHKNHVENTIHKYRNKNLAIAFDKERQKSDDLAQSRAKFLAVASHDLRQPLQALNLLLSTLEHDDTSSKNSQLLTQIEDSTHSLNDLLNHILDISKLDSHSLIINIQACSLSKITRRLIRQFEQKAIEKNIQIINDIPDLWCLSDQVFLERILANLLSNAINYTQSGHVRLFHRLDGKTIHFMVKDTGIGISDEQQVHIFDEFYQVTQQDKRVGVGLGLSIVKRLCHSLDIPLKLKSVLSQGAEFSIALTITLPTSKDLENTPLPQVLALSHVKIAVIDDNEQVLLSLVSMFEHWGMTVFSAASSKQMIMLLQQSMQEPDIIASDYRLANNKNGLDAIKDIKLLFNNEDIPSFLISGETNTENLNLAKESGLVLLHKPVKPSQIRATVQRLINQPKHDTSIQR